MSGARTDTASLRPWYREPWMWLVVGIPASSVLVGLTLLHFAISTFDGLVEDDYYQRGREINRVLARGEAARELELAGRVVVGEAEGGEGSEKTVAVNLAGNERFSPPGTVLVKLHHATRAGFDQRLVLRARGDGRYVAPAPVLEPGYWQVSVEAENWRVVGRMRAPGALSTALVSP